MCHSEVKKLKASYNPNAVKGAKVATQTVMAAGTFAAGNFGQPEALLHDLDESAKALVTALNLANELLTLVKEVDATAYSIAGTPVARLPQRVPHGCLPFWGNALS